MSIYKNEGGKAVRYGGNTVIDNQLSLESENPVQNKVITEEINELKKSVSDGKTAVAAAITEKGVETAADASFSVMAENIASIESGSSGIALNVFTQETEPETKDGIWIQTSNKYENVVVSDNTYIVNEGVECWSDVYTNLPNMFHEKYAATIYDDKIYYIISGVIYAFNGFSWEVIKSDLKYNNYLLNPKNIIEYKNNIHMFGISGFSVHAVWNGESLTLLEDLPYDYYGGGCVVIYNDEIHILGGGTTYGTTNHYKFDGTSWSKVSTLPYALYRGSAIVYNNEIHIMGGYHNSLETAYTYHYKWDGTTWSEVSTLPYLYYDSRAVVHNNEIHIIGGRCAGTGTYHYKWNGVSWSKGESLPYSTYHNACIEYNNSIYVIGGGNNDMSDSEEKKRGRSICYTYIKSLDSVCGSMVSVYQNQSTANGTYPTNFISGLPLNAKNNKFPSGFDDIFYIDESGNVETAPTYYGDGTQWIKLKN